MAVYNLPNYTNDQGFGLPLNIRRGNPNPLDNSAVWASLDAAKNYAKTDPTAYVGQIISVVDNENAVVDVYKINDAAGNLVLVGTVTLGDDQSIVKNDNDTLSLYDFGKKYYKFVAANGDVAAHYEVVEGWRDGLEPKVHDGVLAWYEPNPTTVDGLQSSINNLQAEVDTNKDSIKANTDAIAVLNGDKTTEGSVAYQIAAVVAGANADFDTLKEIADWIATHPDSVATINAAIKGNTDAIADLKDLVGTDAVVDQITAAIEELNIAQYAKDADLNDAIDDISANADAIAALQDLIGDGEVTVDERINDAIKETVDGVEKDKFALREHGHAVSDVDGLGALLDEKATNDRVTGIDTRVQAIETGLDTTIDAAIQTHVAAADAKYETIENVTQLRNNIDVKVGELEKADADNLAAAKTHAETKIAELNITQYAKQADLDETNAAIDTIKDHATVDSFADVMDEIAKKQDIIPENTYDAYGAAAAVDTKLEEYKTATNKRLEDLEAADNVTQDEMDAVVADLEAANNAILEKIGTADGETVVDLIGTAQEAAETAQSKANDAYALAETKATMTEVNAAIEGAGHAVATEVNAAIDGINDKIGDVPADSTVMAEIEKAQAAATYNDTEVRDLINDNAEAIAKEKTDREGAVSELEGKINTKVEQTVYDAKVKELVDEDVRLAGLIGDNTTAIEGLNTQVTTLVGDDAGKSVRAIAAEELTAQLVPTNAVESLNTLQEIATWIQTHPDDASAMNNAIVALQNKVDTGDKTVSAYVTAAVEALNIGDYATVKALADAIAAEVERADGAYAGKGYEATVDGHVVDAVKHITADERAAWNAAEQNAKDYADDQLDAAKDYADQAELDAIAAAKTETESQIATAKSDLQGEISTAKSEAISDAEGKVNAAKEDLQGKIDTVSDDLDDYKTANDEAVALKANVADVYTKAEVEAMFTWGEF